MEEMFGDYEVIVGLEIHIQLLTKSKAYSSDSTEYGALPNTNVSPISLGHPGTLPFFNKRTLEYGIRLGIACGSEIREENQFARKNYFYADLPKGYQITQDSTPLCNGGKIVIKDDEGNDKVIGVTRIHMEEDSGKSIHDLDPYNSLIDLNRAGVPLLELVSEPDIRSPQEAYNYVTEVRKLVRYLDICDGNMEEGSMRCDANVSVRKKGSTEFGQRTETKNLNSIRNVYRAIEFEAKRQIEEIEAGRSIQMETRGFDAVKGITMSQRSKEMAHDYRYFPCPDLLPLELEEGYVERVKDSLPELPGAKKKRFIADYGLSDYDASVLIADKPLADYYEAVVDGKHDAKKAANWVINELLGVLNKQGKEIEYSPVAATQLGELLGLIADSTISGKIAKDVFSEMFK